MKTPKKKQPDPKKLMQSSESKKKMAEKQEMLGKAQIKNKVKPAEPNAGLSAYTGKIKDIGVKVPVGKERLKLAKDMRLSAKLDSLQSVRVSNKIKSKKK
jgi:hypothetical protein